MLLCEFTSERLFRNVQSNDSPKSVDLCYSWKFAVRTQYGFFKFAHKELRGTSVKLIVNCVHLSSVVTSASFAFTMQQYSDSNKNIIFVFRSTKNASQKSEETEMKHARVPPYSSHWMEFICWQSSCADPRNKILRTSAAIVKPQIWFATFVLTRQLAHRLLTLLNDCMRYFNCFL